MATTIHLLLSEVKARVPEAAKQQLQSIADERHLKLSDIIREALREYLARRSKFSS